MRAALARAGLGRRRSTSVLELDAAGASCCPSWRRCRAAQNAASEEIARGQAARARTRPRRSRRWGTWRPRRGACRRARQGRGGAERGARRTAEHRPTTTRRREDTVLREVGEAGRDRPRPPRAGRAADRHGGGGAGLRLALRLPQGRSRDARDGARALGAGEAARPRLRAGRPARARARGGAVRHRLPARHRAADLPAGRRRRSTSSARPRSRSPRCTPARSSTAAALPLRYAGFSPCFRREAGAAGKRHARDLPRAPVRQGRDVRFVAPEARRPSTSACSRSRRRSSRSSSSPTASSTSRWATSAPRAAQEVRPRGVAARPGSATAS